MSTGDPYCKIHGFIHCDCYKLDKLNMEEDAYFSKHHPYIIGEKIFKNMNNRITPNKMKKLPEIILVDETIKRFGYDPNNIKGLVNYSKLVVCKCYCCNDISEIYYSSALRRAKFHKKCLKCSNTELANRNSKERGKNYSDKLKSGELIHPMKGRKHREDSKDKMSFARKGKTYEEFYGKKVAKEIKNKISISSSGENNGFFGKTHSPETAAKLKISRKKNARRGKDSNFYGKKYWSKRQSKEFIYKDIRFRSKWEAKTAKYFDDNNFQWQFEPKAFELNNETYTPDFYLSKQNKWIEVKGYWYDDAIVKFALFKKIYPNEIIEIWDMNKLMELNIL